MSTTPAPAGPQQHVILTALGDDRPGLVDEVSAFIFERGGNIGDSRMVNLRGQFAMMVLIAGSQQTVDRIHGDLPALSARTKLHADLRPADIDRGRPTGAAPSAPADALAYRLSATAIDQSGLVHRIAHALREQGVNIESMDTRLASAPYTGAPMFEMDLVIAVPRSTPIGQLRQQLGRLCDELNIDWQLEAV